MGKLANCFLIFMGAGLIHQMVDKKEAPIWCIILVILFLLVGGYGMLFGEKGRKDQEG